MSVTVNDLQQYRDALNNLIATENVLVEGGLILEGESLSKWNEDFISGRIKRIQTLIDSGRY